MKYVDEYRDGKLARAIAGRSPPRRGRAQAIASWNSAAATPTPSRAMASRTCCRDNVRMIHGPGCPVCVLPIGRIDDAIGLAQRRASRSAPMRDLMRVPASDGMSLLKAKAAGADIRMVYSTLDAVRIAETEPERKVVFFAIGFETTTPPTAMAIRLAAEKKRLKNFSVFCNHVLTPAAIRAILGRSRLGARRGAARRLRRPGARLDRHRHAALRGFRRGLRQAGGDSRLRAARRHAVDPDAGAPDERRPRTKSRTSTSAP